MSGVSVSDVIGAIKLAMIIYDKFFVKVNRADARYVEFFNDIKFLQSQLEKLRKVFEEAGSTLRQESLRGRPTNGSTINSQALEIERIELVGDFHKTLRDCQKLLEQNVRYLNASNDITLTARWYGTGIESQSALLRERVQFHCTKITFIIQPLQLELLASIDRSVQTLKRQNREQLRIIRTLATNGLGHPDNAPQLIQYGLSPVPVILAERYQHQVSNGRPFDNPESFPLKESVNALLYHFGQSTIQVVGGFQTPSNEHFNCLLKARWILGKILESPGFRRLGPCLYRATVENIEDEIECQYERLEAGWDTMKAESLSKLGDEHFSIWVVEELKPMVPLATDEGIGEVKIMELPLPHPPGYSKQSLLIFRQSDTEFRILRASIIEGGNHVVPSKEQIVNMQHFRFVPYYAIPSSGEASKMVGICHNQVHQGDIFDMNTIDDALTVQRALTGYEVAFYNSRMKWEVHRDGFTNRTMRTKGWSGIQIWQWKPLDRSHLEGTSNQLTESRSVETMESEMTQGTTLADDVIVNLPSRAASVISLPTNGVAKEELLASSVPKVPILVIFTYWKNKLCFFHISLDRGTAINLQRCGCKVPNSTCLHTVIEKSAGKLNMKIHNVENQDDQPILADWDLALFSQPRHPKFKSLESVDDISRLDFEFERLEDRKWFQIKLIRTIKGYQQSIDNFNSVAKTLRHLDQKPRALSFSRRLSTSTFASRRPSVATLSPPASPDPWRTPSVSSSSPGSSSVGEPAVTSPPRSFENQNGRLGGVSPFSPWSLGNNVSNYQTWELPAELESTMPTAAASRMPGLGQRALAYPPDYPISELGFTMEEAEEEDEDEEGDRPPVSPTAMMPSPLKISKSNPDPTMGTTEGERILGNNSHTKQTMPPSQLSSFGPAGAGPKHRLNLSPPPPQGAGLRQSFYARRSVDEADSFGS